MSLSTSLLLSGAGAAGYIPNAWNFFNGGSGNNYIQSAGLGLSSGYTGSLSLWFKFPSGPGTFTYLVADQSQSNAIVAYVDVSGTLKVGVGSQAQQSFVVSSSSGAVTGTGWHNVLASWNTNAPAHSKTANLYLDGVNVGSLLSDTQPAFQAYYANFTPFFGSSFTSPTGQLANISMSEIWIAPNQFIDFSTSANRGLFYNSGLPVTLGSSGQLPTGTAPAIYLKSPAASVGVNSGTAGNLFSYGNIASTSPP